MAILAAVCPRAAARGGTPKVAFVGLHGGVFERLRDFSRDRDVALTYLDDQSIASGEADFADYDLVVIQHLRRDQRDRYRQMITSAHARDPDLRIVSISGAAERMFPELVASGDIGGDPSLARYYGTSDENLRRFLDYVLIEYFGRPGTVQPPEEVPRTGLWHPDHDGVFESVEQFLQFAHGRGADVGGSPRAVVAVHLTHLTMQQPDVVAALIRALESRGVVSVAMIDSPEYGGSLESFRPDVVVHTCHSRDPLSLREKLDVPHLHSLFFRQQSIDDWSASVVGLAANEIALQITSQEPLGAIEPLAAAGTLSGGGSAERFVPIADRVEHLADRAAAWIRLRRTDNADKKVAIVYWDREMGKAELMRGSATGMFLNGPRSLVEVLRAMERDGYAVKPVPASEDELLSWMMDHGRQIGVWNGDTLDRLARSGDAVLVPVSTYRRWLERRVPEDQRRQVIEHWGEAPGDFLVWRNAGGEPCIVIPRIDLGNVVLLPQPLRGEAHDPSLVHDRSVPPPHNYLATYFWLQEEFGADAMIHFGTHGTEFMLPGRDTALSRSDWPDIILGAVPNLNPWVINNLGESSPARRRAYAVLIDHLVPASENAELSDELANLHGDIDKWIAIENGALRERFRAAITDQVRAEHLDVDLGFDLADGRVLEPEEIEAVLAYLHDIHNETTPTRLHTLGQPPPDGRRIPYLVTCLRKRFLDGFAQVIDVPESESLTPGDRTKYLRRRAEQALRLSLRRGLSAAEAVVAVGGHLLLDEERAAGLPEVVADGFALAAELDRGFDGAQAEIDNILAALDGRFVPPGQGNSPDRNPGALPTGRNLYVMNPEEVPTRPSWEIGRKLAERMLEQWRGQHGRYPARVAFTLSSFATFQDYGVMESQILFLLGVRPVWDARNLVVDLELIPRAELHRPRIDVFISALGYYRDTLPSRMRLLDKAIRLTAESDGGDNAIARNSQRIRAELEALGTPSDKARDLSLARIFGRPPGDYGNASYYYLIERSGEWNTREELMTTYIRGTAHAYTGTQWIEDVPEAFSRQVKDSELVVRSWSDRTRSPLSNKYDWFRAGSLSLAIEHVGGSRPEVFLSDVRDPDAARMIDAEKALRREFRVRLFNRKWIEGMMKEGFAGADQMAVHVSNTLGWKVMRDGSVSDDVWEEIVDVYLRDSKRLGIRDWFEAENPFAFQEVTEILLEAIRKGFWDASASVRREIASAYAESVARHGENGGLRGGANRGLKEFVDQILAGDEAPLSQAETGSESAGDEPVATARADQPAQPARGESAGEIRVVAGQKLVRLDGPGDRRRLLTLVAGFAAILVFALGCWRRIGVPK